MSKVDCHVCGKPTTPLVSGKYRDHATPKRGDLPEGKCPAVGTYVPGMHPEPEIPGATEYAERLQENAGDAWDWMGPDAQEPVPMTALGLEIAARLKELFYAYDNRRSADNRGAQQTLGPSEIGTPCDRRIALSLLHHPAVNPGGDGWAAFVGTAAHVSLANMLEWANFGSGRYATELPLSFPSEHVPHGTTDVVDRVMCLVGDHKLMGAYSLKKLRTKGPSPQYRVQAHTYGYGAAQKGERIDHVAIIGWPRAGSSLDDLYVWTEPYDPQVAIDAIARVDRIAASVKTYQSANEYMPDWAAAVQHPTADDCRYCPFFGPGKEGGCDGHR